MGLLTRFKASLRSREKKFNTIKNNEVVCVNYRSISSEFEDIPHVAPPTPTRPDLKKNDVFKEKKAPPRKPELQSIFSTEQNNNSGENAKAAFQRSQRNNESKTEEISSNKIKKAQPSTNLPAINSFSNGKITPTPQKPEESINNTEEIFHKVTSVQPFSSSTSTFSNASSKDEIKESIQENSINTPEEIFPKVKAQQPSSSSSFLSTSTPNRVSEENEDQEKSRNKDTDAENFKLNIVNQSDKIQNTTFEESDEETENFYSSSAPPKKLIPPKRVQFIAPLSTSQSPSVYSAEEESDEEIEEQDKRELKKDIYGSHHNYQDGNFKINFVDHAENIYNTVSDEDEDEDEESYGGGGVHKEVYPSGANYSSQAASIFFGGDEEPVVRRPRNFQMTHDEDNLSQGSSASA